MSPYLEYPDFTFCFQAVTSLLTKIIKLEPFPKKVFGYLHDFWNLCFFIFAFGSQHILLFLSKNLQHIRIYTCVRAESSKFCC